MAAPETEQADRTRTEHVPDMVAVDNPHLLRCITQLGADTLSGTELMKRLGLKHRPTFLATYLTPALQAGFIRLLYPESPRHPRQKYLLTVKGLAAIQPPAE